MRNLSVILSLLVLVVLILNIATSNDRILKLEKLVKELESGQLEVDTTLDEVKGGDRELEHLADVQSEWMPAVSLELPGKLTFAGEAVPLQLPDVRERLDRELHINSYMHNSTIFIIKRAARWLPQIEPILKQNNIPDDFKYMPLIESALLNEISPRQAVGFWQIMKPSGRELGLEITNEVDERYDPIKSTAAACKYLKKAYARFGNWTLAAASYDRGMAGLDRARKNQQTDSYYDLFLNDETSRYVFRLLAIKEIIEHPDQYGFRIDPEHVYRPEEVRYVEVDKTVNNLVSFSLSQGTNYKLLKRFNPWLRDEKLTVKKGKRYKIALPAS